MLPDQPYEPGSGSWTASRVRPARCLAPLQLVGIAPQLRLVFERLRRSTAATVRSYLTGYPADNTL